MTFPRLVAIALIFAIAVVGWMILGASVDYRTHSADVALRDKVGGLWGSEQVQRAPAFSGTMRWRVKMKGGKYKPMAAKAERLAVTKSDVGAALDLDQRKKGLLWYATYAVRFGGRYRVHNPHSRAAETAMSFALPNPEGVYDGFRVRVNGEDVPATFTSDGTARTSFDVPAHGAAVVEVAYRTQGLDSWTYEPARGMGSVRDFTLVMTTDFADVDFPDGAVSPTSKAATARGARLTWRYDTLLSGKPISLTMPQPLNPGPVAARISLFAPVPLLFFFAAMVLNTATAKARLHPMHYAFLASGFFAFHLLFAYLVDQVDVNLAFIVAAVTSVALCVGYLRLVLGRDTMIVEAALGQLLFLVLFSYSFFFEGYTGLAITIGAVASLAFYMAKTAKVDWEDVFARGRAAGAGPRPAAAPTGGTG